MVVSFAFLLIFLSRVLFLSLSPAFFDSWEYLRALAAASPIAAFKMVHYPIHPFFIIVGWLFNQIPLSTPLFKAEFFQSLCSLISMFVFYQICLKFSANKQKSLLLGLIFSFLPYIWLSSVNLLYESLLILLLLWSFLFLEKNFWLSGLFFLLAFLVSPVALFYLPLVAVFLLKKSKKFFGRKYLLAEAIYLLAGLAIYYLIIRLRGGDWQETFRAITAGGVLTQKILAEGWLFFPRMLRNTLVIYFNYLTFPLGIILFFLALTDWRKRKLIYFFWLISFLIVSATWHLGMYGRLTLFLIIPPLFLLLKLKNRNLWLILIFLVIYSGKLVLPYRLQKTPYLLEEEFLENAFKKQNPLLVISNYEEPFLKEDFETVVLNIPGEDFLNDQKRIDRALGAGRLVLLTSQAITTPYWQYDGMNYHLLSQRRDFPTTLGQKLICKYQIQVVKEWSGLNLKIYQLKFLAVPQVEYKSDKEEQLL